MSKTESKNEPRICLSRGGSYQVRLVIAGHDHMLVSSVDHAVARLCRRLAHHLHTADNTVEYTKQILRYFKAWYELGSQVGYNTCLSLHELFILHLSDGADMSGTEMLDSQTRSGGDR
jgi:hypothetical protein